MNCYVKILTLLCLISNANHAFDQNTRAWAKPRVIITSDAEIDDECSFVRCLLYANDFDIEGIISTSSQYHAHDHRWAAGTKCIAVTNSVCSKNLYEADLVCDSLEHIKLDTIQTLIYSN
jgi:hypothetical protein